MSKAQAEVPKVFFQKELPDKRKILVLRKEVPYSPPPPGDVYVGTGESRITLTPSNIKPDRNGEFSLFLVSNRIAFRRLLWKKTIPEYLTAFHEPKFKIFDVFFDNDILVVIYNLGTDHQAEVVTPEHPYDKKVLDRNRIFYDEGDEEPSVASATVQRWGKAKTLSLAVRFSDGKTARYLWTPEAKAGESKWVMVPKPPSPDLPEPVAPDPAESASPRRRRQPATTE